MDRQTAVDFLLNRPVDYARMLGFNKLSDLHNSWIVSMVRGKEDGTLMAHRASYKTTCVSIALAEIIILLPRLRTMFMRKTDTDIKEVIKQVQKILLDPHTQYFVQCIYGVDLKLTVQTANEISTNLSTDVKGSAQLIGIGTGGSLTGKHYDRIFTDDIINLQDRISKAERDRTKLVYQELQNIKNRGGRIFNTLTPWHKEDAYTLMPEAKKFTCYDTGIISKEALEQIRQSMSPSLFAANYELVHIAAENALFETAPKFFSQPELLRDGIAHIDAAYGGEDYTAFTCGKRVGDTLYMYGKMWHNHIDTVLERILADCERLACAPVYCEDNADKGFLGKEIKRLMPGMPVRTYTERENKYMKISSYLRKWWGNIVWLDGTDKDYLAQIMDYTEDAEHDDACLAGDTLIATLTGDKPIKDIKIGEYVITPAGVRKVLFAGVTGYKAVQNYHGLFATPDHKIFDKCNGTFSRADSLACVASYDIISLKELIVWKTRLLCSTAKPMSEIQRADITSSTQQEIASAKMRGSCTEPSGNITTGKSRQGITYTTLMVMSIITTLATWSVYKLGNICRAMQGKILKTVNIGGAIKNNCLHNKKKQKNGTEAKPGQNGIANMHKNLLSKQTSTTLKSSVNSVAKRILELCNNGSVLKVAVKKRGGAELDLNSSRARKNAHIAERHSLRTMSDTNFVVQNANSNIIPVYNLTVEKAGCYYANGILVSNCDSAACVCRLFDRRALDSYQSVFGG
jgi:hypothetical protein